MLDSSARLTGLLCGTQPMNDIWAPRATLQRMLDVEAALARASALHHVIPDSAVPAIEAASWLTPSIMSPSEQITHVR